MSGPTLLPLRRMAELFGVSERTMRTWLTGLTPDQVTHAGAGGRGRHLYSVPRVIEHHFAPRHRDDDGEILDLAQERARLASEQADKQKRENMIAEGDTIEWSKMRPVLVGAWSTARARLLALPRELAPQLIGLPTVPEVEAILDDGIREALLAAAEVDELGSDSQDLDTGSDGGWPEAAAETDDQPVG